MTVDRALVEFAVQRRREVRREEWKEQAELAELLRHYLDPACVFWTSLENKPLSMISGFLGRKRGVRGGLPDIMCLVRYGRGTRVAFIEIKSFRSKPSPVQRQVRLELLATGAKWWMVRSARAGLEALRRSGVPFRRTWKLPRLQPWEGPFPDPGARLPMHPLFAAEKRAERARYRLRKAARKRAAVVAEQDQANNVAVGATQWRVDRRGFPQRVAGITVDRNKAAAIAGVK